MKLGGGGVVGLILQPSATVAAYSGPGDVLSTGSLPWWGLRAYSSSVGTIAAVKLFDATASSMFGDVFLKTNGDLDISPLNAGHTYHVDTLYDQTGNGFNLTQSTDANRPVFTFNAVGTLPGMTFSGGTQGLKSANVTPTQAQPISSASYAIRNGSFTTQADILQARGGLLQCLFAGSANQVAMYAGVPVVAVTCSDSHWHSLIWVFNGSSSDIIVDGTSNAPLTTGTNGLSSNTYLMGDDGSAGGNPLTAIVTEGGWWPSDVTSNSAALRSNAQNYWKGA